MSTMALYISPEGRRFFFVSFQRISRVFEFPLELLSTSSTPSQLFQDTYLYESVLSGDTVLSLSFVYPAEG